MDHNKIQSSQFVKDIINIEPLVKKLNLFKKWFRTIGLSFENDNKTYFKKLINNNIQKNIKNL